MSWYNPFTWGESGAKRNAIATLDELIAQIARLVQAERTENAKIERLLGQMKNATTFEAKLQAYIALKAEIEKDREIDSAVKALEEQLKSKLGKHLSEMQKQL